MISTAVLLVSVVLGFAVVFWAKRRVKNLNFYTRLMRDGSSYPLKVYLELRNYTGRTVVISGPYFVYNKLMPDPNARGDIPSGEYEIKFPAPDGAVLSEVEYMLRHRESVSTWVPLDPSHTDQEVEAALRAHEVGKFRCMCAWLQDKPKVHKLRRDI